MFFSTKPTHHARSPTQCFPQGEKRDFNCHCQIDIPILRHCQIDIPILAESVLRQTNACFQVCAIQKKVTHRDRHHTLLNQTRRSFILQRCSVWPLVLASTSMRPYMTCSPCLLQHQCLCQSQPPPTMRPGMTCSHQHLLQNSIPES